jgi:hypothetical protein
VPFGDSRETSSRGKLRDFLTETPYCLTELGSFGVAWVTRFWVSTLAMSRSVPTSNETSSVKVPSLALMDFM